MLRDAVENPAGLPNRQIQIKGFRPELKTPNYIFQQEPIYTI